jgi:hypothetical protein
MNTPWVMPGYCRWASLKMKKNEPKFSSQARFQLNFGAFVMSHINISVRNRRCRVTMVQ